MFFSSSIALSAVLWNIFAWEMWSIYTIDVKFGEFPVQARRYNLGKPTYMKENGKLECRAEKIEMRHKMIELKLLLLK